MNYRDKIYQNYASGFQHQGYRRKDVIECWRKTYGWYFREWLPKDKQAKILDVGCGGGQLLRVFRAWGYENNRGIDISEEQVGVARAAGLEVEKADVIVYLQAKGNEFDVITAIDIMEHLTKDAVLEFLEAAHGALRPGGRLILQMPNPDSPLGMRIRYGDLTHEVCIGPDCAKRLLALSGFVHPEAREAGPLWSWHSPLGAGRWLMWRCIRGLLLLYEFAETGGFGSRIHTRVYLVSACCPV